MPPSDLVHMFRDTVVALVACDERDLSARQLGVFLKAYTEDRHHTVSGLAADLNVSLPAITQALNVLGHLGLTQRKPNPLNRRYVHVQRTPRGTAFLFNVYRMLEGAAEAAARSRGQESDTIRTTAPARHAPDSDESC